MQGGVFLKDFLSKCLHSSLKWKIALHRNTYKCIAIFRFLHTIRAFSRQGFLSKNLWSNLKCLNVYDHTIYNNNLPFRLLFSISPTLFGFRLPRFIMYAELYFLSVHNDVVLAVLLNNTYNDLKKRLSDRSLLRKLPGILLIKSFNRIELSYFLS